MRLPQTLKGDIFGGITAGVVALPLALAFGVASGMGPAAGLYGAAAAGIFAAMFGGTPTQITGPTGPMTVITAVVVASHLTSSGQPDFPVLAGVFVLAGLFELLLGVIRIGAYVRYIPYPVVSGFMTGIGVIIITIQIFPFFGRTSPSSDPLHILISLNKLWEGISIPAALLATVTVALIYLFRQFARRLPATLLSLVIVSSVSYMLGLDVPLIGEVPQGLPKFIVPPISIDYLQKMMVPAMELALLGAIDSLLTSLVADNMTRTNHNSNQELIGQGIGNMVGGFFGGIPAAGATMRTVVNINSGGKTRLSGIIHGLFLVGVLLGGAKLVHYIPQAVLAGVLVTVGLTVMDYKGLRHIRDVPRLDAGLMLFVLFLTVFENLITAVVAGVVLASFVFMKKISDITEKMTTVAALDDEPWADELGIPQDAKSHVLIKHIDGPLFFGFAPGFQRMANNLNSGRIVVFRLDRVNYIDQTGLFAFDEAIKNLRRNGVRVIIAGISGFHLAMLERVHVIPDLVPPSDVFPNFEDLKALLPKIVSETCQEVK
jgi:SulP family sulfate permease